MYSGPLSHLVALRHTLTCNRNQLQHKGLFQCFVLFWCFKWSSFINHLGQSPNMHTPAPRRGTVLLRGWGTPKRGDTADLPAHGAHLPDKGRRVKSCCSKLYRKHIEKYDCSHLKNKRSLLGQEKGQILSDANTEVSSLYIRKWPGRKQGLPEGGMKGGEGDSEDRRSRKNETLFSLKKINKPVLQRFPRFPQDQDFSSTDALKQMTAWGQGQEQSCGLLDIQCPSFYPGSANSCTPQSTPQSTSVMTPKLSLVTC